MLWELVRGKQLGFKFRSQHPFPPFILDFYCPQARVAVELDELITLNRPMRVATSFSLRKMSWSFASRIAYSEKIPTASSPPLRP